MQSQWKDRVLEALEQALRVADRRGKGTGKTVRCINRLDDREKEALGTLILSRVMLQMESALRGHPNYQKACRVLEELPLWSLDQETALHVIDALSSILGLPFRYDPLKEDEVACCDEVLNTRSGVPIRKPIEEPWKAYIDVGVVVKAKLEQAKELIGVERIVK